MQNKIIFKILILVLCLSSAPTYAATNASLWSSIDQPVPPIQQIEEQQKQAEAEQQAIANQLTVCELLSAQPSLNMDTANSAKIRDAIQQAYKVTLPDYKMFLVNTDTANALYVKYRELYIKTYCVAGR